MQPLKHPFNIKLIKHKQVNRLIKILVLALLLYAIYSQVFAREDAEDIWASFAQNLNSTNLIWLMPVIALMFVNLSFEVLKWQSLVRNFANIPFFKCFQAVLAGATFSIFTPGRVGDYGGRILLVDAEHNWKAIIATAVGNISQIIVILSCGFLGSAYFFSHYLEFDPYLFKLFLIIGLSLISLTLFGFFNIDLLIPIVRRLPFYDRLQRYLKHLKVLKNYTFKELLVALLLSLCKYLTYSTQFYLMLRFFGFELPILTAYTGIATIYFIQLSMPLPPIVESLARGEIALVIWAFLDPNPLTILAAIFSVFIINIAIPALVGTLFIFKINVLKSLGYEKKTDRN